MPKRTVDHHAALLVELQNPEDAAHYINAALEDSEEMLLVALRDVAEAREMSKIAKEAGVAREALYRMLSNTGNPQYKNLAGVLAAVGLRIRVEAVRRAKDPRKNSTKREALSLDASRATVSAPIADIGEYRSGSNIFSGIGREQAITRNLNIKMAPATRKSVANMGGFKTIGGSGEYYAQQA